MISSLTHRMVRTNNFKEASFSSHFLGFPEHEARARTPRTRESGNSPVPLGCSKIKGGDSAHVLAEKKNNAAGRNPSIHNHVPRVS